MALVPAFPNPKNSCLAVVSPSHLSLSLLLSLEFSIMLALFILFSFSLFLHFSRSRIISAYIVPHGDVILDPSAWRHEPVLFNETSLLHDSYVRAGSMIRSDLGDEPNNSLVFLTTPHGMALEYSFGLYVNERGYGDATSSEGEYGKFTANVTMDQLYAKTLYDSLSAQHQPIEGLVASSEDLAFPLEWGSVIPAYFTEKKNSRSNNYVMLSFPRRRLLEGGIPMLAELQTLGSDFFQLLNQDTRNVVIVISGDLSHCHPNRFGPNPYPIRPVVAKLYDEAIRDWVQHDGQSSYLMEKATDLAKEALSCGYTEFVFLHGLMEMARSVGMGVEGEVIQDPMAPTYFGMMLGRFGFK